MPRSPQRATRRLSRPPAVVRRRVRPGLGRWQGTGGRQAARWQIHNAPRTASNLLGEGEQWLSSPLPPGSSDRTRERYVKPVRQALRDIGADIVTLHMAGRSLSLFTGPMSHAQRALLSRPMILREAGHARKHSLPPARLCWDRIRPAGEREEARAPGAGDTPAGPPAPPCPVPPPALKEPLQSAVWRLFNKSCASEGSAPDLLGSGQRLRQMGVQVAEARDCAVRPGADWSETMAADGRRGVEFLLRGPPESLGVIYRKLLSGVAMPCRGGGPAQLMATACVLAFTGSPRGAPSAALLATWRGMAKRHAEEAALSGADTPPRSPGRPGGRSGGKGRGRGAGRGTGRGRGGADPPPFGT